MGWIIVGILLILVGVGGSVAFAIKPGAVPSDKPEMVFMRQVFGSVWNQWGYTLTITSGIDSEHKQGSLHYVGLAEDYRTHDVKREHLQGMLAQVREALGEPYQVILENFNGPNEHVHGEYDPQRLNG